MHNPRRSCQPHAVGRCRHNTRHSPEAAAVGRLDAVESSSVIHRQPQFAPDQYAVGQGANRLNRPDTRSARVVIDLGLATRHAILIGGKVGVVGHPQATLLIHGRRIRRPVWMILEHRSEAPLPVLHVKLAPAADGNPYSSPAVRCG